jgi:hypothetical protein
VAYFLVAVLIGIAAYAALRSFLSFGLAILGAIWITCVPVLVAIAIGGRYQSPTHVPPDTASDDGALVPQEVASDTMLPG